MSNVKCQMSCLPAGTANVNWFIRLLFFIATFLTSYFLLLNSVAAAEFATSYDVVYEVAEDGKTEVTSTISLTNLVTNLYATQYSMVVKNTNVTNVQGADNQGPLKTSLDTVGDETTITVSFNEVVVGKGSTLTFTLSYQSEAIAKRLGRVWEVILPKVARDESINHYNATLVVPASFANELYFKPEPKSKEQRRYTWTYDQISNQVITAAFGQSQLFSFHLTYHLSNPDQQTVFSQIALPPDTAYQKVTYTQVSPKPILVEIDDNGNWLATYQLSSNEQREVMVSGFAEIFIKPRSDFPRVSQEKAKNFLQAETYWPVDDPTIKTVAAKLKTPEEIYHYVVESLSYDYTRVTNNPVRLGAKEALKRPKKSICMEFTDLAVTLFRAAQIPARELNGFAYTTNSELRPLSLIADVLHAWPEYYDREKKVWIQIDPTWGNTTDGIDYFSALDVNHLVFAIHGTSSEYPPPAGAYKLVIDGDVKQSRDVEVIFAEKIPEIVKQPLSVQIDLAKVFLVNEGEASLFISNPNGQAVYNTLVTLTSDAYEITPSTFSIKSLPPWGSMSFPIKLKSRRLFPWYKATIDVNTDNNHSVQTVQTVDTRYSLVVLSLPAAAIFGGVGFFLYRKLRKRRHFKSRNPAQDKPSKDFLDKTKQTDYKRL